MENSDSNVESPLNIGIDILKFTKDPPLNLSIQLFNKFKSSFNPLNKKSKLPQPLIIHNKWNFATIPNIHEPSECETLRDTFRDDILFSKIAKENEMPDEEIRKRIIISIFRHNFDDLSQILSQNLLFNINFIDDRGNSPLMLATKLAYSHLDYYKIIKLLLCKGASPKFTDPSGFSIFEEALAQADIIVISMLFDKLTAENKVKFEIESLELDETLLKLQDFYLEIKWEFESSYLPIISRIAPTDTFKIWKIGKSLRLDSNLIELSIFKPKKRDLSLIYHKRKLHLLNRTNQFYTDIMQDIDLEEKQALIYDLMNPDIRNIAFEITGVELKKNNSFFFNKACRIQGFYTKKYDMMVMYKTIRTKKKHSYLAAKYEEYIRKIGKVEENAKKVKKFKQEMFLWISEEFPIKLKEFLPLMNVLARGNTLMGTLLKFLDGGIEGFPLKIQIPLNFAFKAVVTFNNFKNLSMSSNIFDIPQDFTYRDRKNAQKTYKHKTKRLLLAELFLK